MSEAQVAGKMAYDVMDQVPLVSLNSTGKIADREEMTGSIVFKNVNFRYPTRDEV